MPRIELIPEVLYNPLDPIHYEYDNLPLKGILKRIELVNYALDNVLEQIRDASGTQNTVSNRLNQSINEDGSLKKASINNSMHSIEDHEDTDDYVRLTKTLSDKLQNIAEEATNLKLELDISDALIQFGSGTLKIMPSDTIVPEFESPNVLKFNMNFPTEIAHRHYYSNTPIQITDGDFIHYKINSLSSPSFQEDTLRVYINGLRIFEDMNNQIVDSEVYVPGSSINLPWTLISFTSNHLNGTFNLSSSLSDSDVIRIDYDILVG